MVAFRLPGELRPEGDPLTCDCTVGLAVAKVATVFPYPQPPNLRRRRGSRPAPNTRHSYPQAQCRSLCRVKTPAAAAEAFLFLAHHRQCLSTVSFLVMLECNKQRRMAV